MEWEWRGELEGEGVKYVAPTVASEEDEEEGTSLLNEL